MFAVTLMITVAKVRRKHEGGLGGLGGLRFIHQTTKPNSALSN